MRAILLLCFILLWFASIAADAQGVPSPQPIVMSDAECAVWDRERSFSQSVAEHDAASFAEHLHPGAVFIGNMPVRGAPAVVTQWRDIVSGEGTGLRLRWYPERVVIGGDPDLALSMGPYWVEDPKPDANPRFRTGRFISTWKRDGNGVWHVVFDGGGDDHPQPATADEIAAMRIALPKTCPRS